MSLTFPFGAQAFVEPEGEIALPPVAAPNRRGSAKPTEQPTELPCFVRGARIATLRGEVPVEALKVGDRVLTRDNGFQDIRWIGSRRMASTGRTAPVVIRAGALGNAGDLSVSPLHHVLVTGWKAELITGEREVLAPAKALVDGSAVQRLVGQAVEYFHILFDAHQVILSDGVFSESFHPGHTGLGAFEAETRAEICEIFPELDESGATGYGAAARRVLKPHEIVLIGDL